ncbi:hypothetical protein JI75_06140 [Berryella intestinalis]|uniref:Uncharacterized protein n=1 Tax=Berryella intestinalis TaxID=1531429 RepID=A0A0A8B4M4_9ACTN|nr:hypothetical protein JI75_06140 [Berryella intestinalis]
MAQAGVARSGQAGVFLRNDHDALVAGAVLLEDQRRRVGRAVIHAHHLEIGERLGQHAVEALLQEALDVVHGDDHGNTRLHTLPFV